MSAATTRTPLQQAARTANVWGWSYIVTILALFTLPGTPPGILRTLVVNTSVLFFIIGILELVWRRMLLKTREARWAYVLAFNEVGGTFALIWNISLLNRVPEDLLATLISPETRASLNNFAHTMHQTLTEDEIEHSLHIAKLLTSLGVGALLFFCQIWVIYRYYSLGRKIAAAPEIPPTL